MRPQNLRNRALDRVSKNWAKVKKAVALGGAAEFAKATHTRVRSTPLSRGYGELQRHCSHGHTADRFKGLDTLALAQAARGRELTRGELVSVRRALAALMRAGEVSHLGFRYGHRHHWVRAQARRERRLQ